MSPTGEPVPEMQPLAQTYQSLSLYSTTPDVSTLYSTALVPQMQFDKSTIKP